MNISHEEMKTTKKDQKKTMRVRFFVVDSPRLFSEKNLAPTVRRRPLTA